MAGAILEPAGSGVAGVQPKGITQQYQLAATASNLNTSTGIHPLDTGTILGTVPPGKPGLKLVDGTIQRSNQLKCDATSGNVGNALVGVAGTGVAVPAVSAGAHQSDGLSGAPERE
jgi:hypothetical protein